METSPHMAWAHASNDTKEGPHPPEQHWTRYFDTVPDSPEAVISDVLASLVTGATHPELESIRRRTKAGLSFNQVGWGAGRVSRTTVGRYLAEEHSWFPEPSS